MPSCVFHSLVHCDSDYSKKSFFQWVKGAIFSPTMGVKVRVGEIEYGTFRPTATCAACRSKWEESGLERVIHNVNWDLVRSRKDVEALVRFYAFVCWYIYNYTHIRG